MKKFYEVTTVSVVISKYIVPVSEEGNSEWAKDSITCNEIDPYDENFVNESIIDCVELSSADVKELRENTILPQINDRDVILNIPLDDLTKFEKVIIDNIKRNHDLI